MEIVVLFSFFYFGHIWSTVAVICFEIVARRIFVIFLICSKKKVQKLMS